MNVLVFTDRPYGPGRYSMEHPLLEQVFAQILPRRGHRVVFWLHATARTRGGATLPWHDASVRLLPSAGPVAGSRLINAAMRAAAVRAGLAAVVREERIDVVQVRNDWIAATVGAPILRRLGVPMVFQWSFPHPLVRQALVDDGLAPRPAWSRWRAGREQRAFRRAIDAADHVMPISQWMRDDLARQGVPADRMTPLPLGVEPSPPADPDARARIRARFNLGERPVVLYFGEMGRLRRMEFLIDAMALVRARVPEVRLLMVGAGDSPADLERLRRHAGARGLAEAVVFTGYVPRAEIPGFIGAADVGVSPIRPIPLYWISSPTKFVEMLGAACPVVASDIPEQRTIVDASGGGVAVPYDERAFADAIAGVLAMPAAERAAMGARGRAFIARERSLERLADIVEGVYARVASRA